MVEFAVMVPIMILMLFGGLAVGTFASDKAVIGYSTRQGARLAAELGGTSSGLTQAQLDQRIVGNVLAVAKAANGVTIIEIDVYQVTNADGSYRISPADPIDKYSGSGAMITPQGAFTPALRTQTPPTETSIGVRVIWKYTDPAKVITFPAAQTDWAVMKAAPVIG